MNFRTLKETYSKKNFRQSLRYEICEILYHDYKGATFFADQLLREKKSVLKKVKKLFKEHPELNQLKDNEQYWYPYPDVSNNP